MSRTTPPPELDFVHLLPWLGPLLRKTTRLHPRPGTVEAKGDSKIGGCLVWPRDVDWPTCDDHPDGPRTLAPVLQLRKRDSPLLRFPEGTDLLQMLWCPHKHTDELHGVPRPFVFWRRAADVTDPLEQMPDAKGDPRMRIRPCRLHPEEVEELPHWLEWSWEWRPEPDPCEELGHERVRHGGCDQLLSEVYCSEATAPGIKVGGYPLWRQMLGSPSVDPTEERPRCAQGHPLDHLLSWQEEANAGSWWRWLPLEDARARELLDLHDRGVEPETRAQLDEQIRVFSEVLYPTEFGGMSPFGRGRALHVFICRRCSGWPIWSVSSMS